MSDTDSNQSSASYLRGAVPWVLVALVGAIAFLPRITSFGFWDPFEIKVADLARAMVEGKSGWFAPASGKAPGLVWLPALGFRWFGIGEFGGRCLGALASIATMLATFGFGARLVSRRAAFYSAILLGLAPGFLMSARQLTSFAFPSLLLTLGVGGLVLAAAPNDAAPGSAPPSPLSRGIGAMLALIGMVLGSCTVGVLVAVGLPVLVLLVAFQPGTSQSPLADAPWTRLVRLGVVLAFALYNALALRTKGYSVGFGGIAHALNHNTVWTAQLKQLGFAFFPWIALVPVAIAQLLTDGDEQRRYGRLTIAAWIILGYGLCTLQGAATTAELVAPIGPALALGAGAYLDDVLNDRVIRPIEAFIILLTAIFIGHDYLIAPEEFISAHLTESARWPTFPAGQGLASLPAHIPQFLIAIAALWGGLVALAIGAPLVSSKLSADQAWPQHQYARRILIGGSFATLCLLAIGTAQYVTPEVSKHLSARDIYGKTRELNPNAPIAQYRFNASGASYYSGGKGAPQNLNSLAEVFAFLGKPERVFVMAGVDELAAIDQEARAKSIKYYVIDDSNSRYLVISNQVGANESDKNPLRQFVLETAPKPPTALTPPVSFEDKLELIGYELPSEVNRGADFKVRLYFHVKQPLGGTYKIFMHFDGGGSRFNGDHVPVGGRFPTQNWAADTYIIDEFTVTPDRAQQPTAVFQLWMGLFQGGKRMKITAGEQDPDGRAKLGRIHVK